MLLKNLRSRSMAWMSVSEAIYKGRRSRWESCRTCCSQRTDSARPRSRTWMAAPHLRIVVSIQPERVTRCRQTIAVEAIAAIRRSYMRPRRKQQQPKGTEISDSRLHRLSMRTKAPPNYRNVTTLTRAGAKVTRTPPKLAGAFLY
jgi:hypothetical protein